MQTSMPARVVRFGLAAVTLLGAVQGARADEGGLGDFLSSLFGNRPQPAASIPEPASPSPTRRRPRALTVRLHPARPRLVAQVPAKPGKVSIFEDRTLRRGDAVVTMDGVRIFAGSASFPYTAGDFIALKDDHTLDRGATRALAQIDRLPRG